jgi:epoxyqueuosine reductase
MIAGGNEVPTFLALPQRHLMVYNFLSEEFPLRKTPVPVAQHLGPAWLFAWMQEQRLTLWGAADLEGFPTPQDGAGLAFPRALAWALPMNPQIMADISAGPNQAYADEYARVNQAINDLAERLSQEIRRRGFRAQPLAASVRTDTVNIRGDFPHKTAATRAGLGWVGRHCQLVTRQFGPWVRLGTVFTDMELPCGPPLARSFCGRCRRCVEACPARALTGGTWHLGLPREALLDARACDQWKKAHYFQYHQGHNCGICAAVCPYGLKLLKMKSGKE